MLCMASALTDSSEAEGHIRDARTAVSTGQYDTNILGGWLGCFRCVTTETCANEWYLRTSDKPICLAFDPMGVPPDLSCHYCCVGNGCNTGLVPDYNVLWRP